MVSIFLSLARYQAIEKFKDSLRLWTGKDARVCLMSGNLLLGSEQDACSFLLAFSGRIDTLDIGTSTWKAWQLFVATNLKMDYQCL